MKKVAVIGSGPSGLMCIYSLIESGITNITLFESDYQIGKRIRVSGNGRCNFFHNPITYEEYSSLKVKDYMEEFLINKEEIFLNLGLVYKEDDEGRMYPMSDSSRTVVRLFDRLLKRNRIKVRLQTLVTNIKEVNDKVKVFYNDVEEEFDEVVLAIGGFSFQYDKAQKLEFMEKINAKLTTLKPSLTPIITSKYKNKDLEGKRFKVALSLYENDSLIHKENGEILFKKDGLSGIVTFNISALLARRRIDNYSSFSLKIDFAPFYSKKELSEIIYDPNFTLEENLEHLFIEELKDEILMLDRKNIINNIKEYKLNVIGLYPLSSSQVTSGGIDLSTISSSFNLNRYKHIYPCGEILDIDGLCGGYNIAFAFASGYKIGKIIANK